MCSHPISLYKSCRLLFILDLYKKRLLFLLLFRTTQRNQLVCYYFQGLTYLCLSPQKVRSLISFLDCLALQMLNFVACPLFWIFLCLHRLIVRHERFCLLHDKPHAYLQCCLICLCRLMYYLRSPLQFNNPSKDHLKPNLGP